MNAEENVTLICVAGVRIADSIKALIHCNNLMKFKETILVSPYMPETNRAKFIKHKEYKNLNNFLDFNKFMFYELWKYFDTSHCLFVHHDGFIVRPTLWDNSFLEYDWIGAPWSSYRNNVGNGGFSLRSKHLLSIPSKHNIQMTMNHLEFPIEDLNFCVNHYDTFVSNGCKFPTVDIAAKFSTEMHIHNVTTDSFGIHDFRHVPRYINHLDYIEI